MVILTKVDAIARRRVMKSWIVYWLTPKMMLTGCLGIPMDVCKMQTSSKTTHILLRSRSPCDSSSVQISPHLPTQCLSGFFSCIIQSFLWTLRTVINNVYRLFDKFGYLWVFWNAWPGISFSYHGN